MKNRIKKISLIIPSIIASFGIPLIGITSCAPKATSIEIMPRQLEIGKLEKFKLQYEVYPRNADQTVTWTSSNESVVAVDGDGIVTALKTGEATITASCNSDSKIYDECPIRVSYAAAESISLDIHNLVLVGPSEESPDQPGESHDILATILPAEAEQEIAWEVVGTKDAIDVKKSTEPGAKSTQLTVTALALDTVELDIKVWPAKYKDTVKPDICHVKVVPDTDDPIGVIVIPDKLTILTNSFAELTAEVQPATALQKVTWTSQTPNTVKVEPIGDTKAKITTNSKTGVVNIVATAVSDVPGVAAVSGKCVVTVKEPVRPQRITLDQDSLYLTNGQSSQLVAVVEPTTETWNLVWKSKDENVVKVDQTGKVTYVGPGYTEIVVHPEGFEGVYDTCEIYCRSTLDHKITFKDAEGGTLSGDKVVTVKDGTLFKDIKKPTPNPSAGWKFFGWSIPDGTDLLEDVTVEPMYYQKLETIELEEETEIWEDLPVMEKTIVPNPKNAYKIVVDTNKCTSATVWGHEFFFFDAVAYVKGEMVSAPFRVSSMVSSGVNYQEVTWITDLLDGGSSKFLVGNPEEPYSYYGEFLMAIPHTVINRGYKVEITLKPFGDWNPETDEIRFQWSIGT